MAKTEKQFEKIIKLNEELTAENARLLEELEGITEDKNMAENNYNKLKSQFDFLRSERDLHLNRYENEVHLKCNERNMRKDLSEELTSIKSKWWYKLMTWGW